MIYIPIPFIISKMKDYSLYKGDYSINSNTHRIIYTVRVEYRCLDKQKPCTYITASLRH